MKSFISFFAFLGLSLSLLYYSVQPVYAGSIVVTTTSDANAADGECSLREALVAASTNSTFQDCAIAGVPGVDTIDLTGITGTIMLTDTLPPVLESVMIQGPGRDNLTIDGGNQYNAFLGNIAPITMTIDGLSVVNIFGSGVQASSNITVTNSLIQAEGCGVLSEGGGVYVANSEIVSLQCDAIAAEQSVIVHSSVISGAVDGIFSFDGAIDAISSTIRAGIAGVNAFADVQVNNTTITAVLTGTFSFDGSATIISSTITTEQEDGDGVVARTGADIISSTITANNNGILMANGDVLVRNSTINSLTDDGIDANTGNIIVENSELVANETAIDTGNSRVMVTGSRLIGNEAGIDTIGSVTVISSTVTGNTDEGIVSNTAVTVSYSLIVDSGTDGVIAPSVTVFQSTISGNGGDGVQSSSQTAISVTQSTIVNNGGYGINNAGGTNDVINSLVARNGSQVFTLDVNGTITGRYNLVGNGDGAGVTDGVDGNLVGSTGNLLDPEIALIADKTSYTGTHSLLPNSPAIDHIPSALCAADDDQRGEARPKGAGCDIGAYEAGGGRITIIKSASPADGTDFTFVTNALTSGSFTLDDVLVDDGDAFTSTQVINGLEPNRYTFTETVPALWALTAISCDSGSWSADLDGAGVAIDLTGDETIVCTFSNSERPDLQLAKTDHDLSVMAGDTLTYTLTYTNAGGSATGVVLTETVPLSTTFDAAASTAGWSCLSNGTCTLDIGTLDKDGTGTALFVVTVDTALTSGGMLTNTATIGDNGSSGTDLNTADNQATETTIVIETPTPEPTYGIYLPLILTQP